MKKLKRRLVDRLDLQAALIAEGEARNRLLPPEPGWEAILANPEGFTGWVYGELRSGFQTSEQLIVGARKAQHGVRPFSVWGLAERTVYRALVNRLLGESLDPVRSVDAYREFLYAPVRYALEAEKPRRQARFTAEYSRFRYIVKSDITAFYQYVDHEILANELALVTDDFDLVDFLIELLQEVQGRRFGLPQGLTPSDRLADLYIGLVERNLVRQGIPIWRYSDDFRIACEDYAHALDSIEKLDAAARDVGLVVNEYKTVTPSFMTYVEEVLGIDRDAILVDALEQESEGDDVEDGDYTDIGSVTPDDALQTISAVKPLKTQGRRGSRNEIRHLAPERLRDLRLSWTALARAGDIRGIEHVQRFFSYTRSLTPYLVRYLISVSDVDPERVTETARQVVGEASLNDWQRGWLVALLGEVYTTAQTAAAGESELLAWLRALASDGVKPVLQAQAVNALAKGGELEFDMVDNFVRTAPGALTAWYVDAARALVEYDESLQTRFQAMLSTTPTFRWMAG